MLGYSRRKEGAFILFTNATPEFPEAHPGESLTAVYFLDAVNLYRLMFTVYSLRLKPRAVALILYLPDGRPPFLKQPFFVSLN
jgi:hypothetical protein